MSKPLDLVALRDQHDRQWCRCNFQPIHTGLPDMKCAAMDLITELESERKLHEITKLFYDLVVKERDFERARFDRVEAQRDALQAALEETQKLLRAALGSR